MARLLAVILAVAVLAGCMDKTLPTQTTARVATGPVRYSLGVQVSAAGKTLVARIGYRRVGQSAGDIVLTEQRLDLTAQLRDFPLSVDIAPCLSDAQRELPPSSSSSAPACVLHTTVTLLDASNQQIDQSSLPPITGRPGDETHAELALGMRTSFVSLAGGWYHTCRTVTTSGGTTACWGSNQYGQLGTGDGNWIYGPDTLRAGLKFSSIATGQSLSTCGLTVPGKAYCWGQNLSGQLGDGTQTASTKPVPVATALAFASITTGYSTVSASLNMGWTCALTSDGTAYCWGSNEFGQLGDSTTTDRAAPTRVAGGLRFASIGAGNSMTCGLTLAGAAYCWGLNSSGSLGGGSGATASVSSPRPVSGGLVFRNLYVGGQLSCALIADGTPYCWGKNSGGQLGDGTTATAQLIPKAIGNGLKFASMGLTFDVTCGLTSAGVAYCWGAGGRTGDGTTIQRNAPTPVAGGLTFTQIYPGSRIFCGTTAAGQAHCWGFNGFAQIGDGSLTDRVAPQAVRGGYALKQMNGYDNNTCALLGDGTPLCWGVGLGFLGASPRFSSLSTPVSGLSEFTQISAGAIHSCGLSHTGVAFCWGDNSFHQLGDSADLGRAKPTPVQSPVVFTQLVSGSDFNCGLTSAGAAYCWGQNLWGALGDGTNTAHATPAPVIGGKTFTRLAAGGNFICGLTNGPMYCWGSVTGVATPAQVALGPIAVGGSDVTRLTSLAGGSGQACGLTADGVAMCFGRNLSGQLGDGTTVSQLSALVPVAGGLRFVWLTSGGAFTCGIATDGFSYCWGSNLAGQLGDGTLAPHLTPTRVATNILFATLVAGLSHVCGSTSSGAVYCWGSNAGAQLGDGSTTDRLLPTLVATP